MAVYTVHMICRSLTSMEESTQMVLYLFKVSCSTRNNQNYYTGTFGCLEFSPDDNSLVYLAEQKEPKKQSYLQFGLTTQPEGTKVVYL